MGIYSSSKCLQHEHMYYLEIKKKKKEKDLLHSFMFYSLAGPEDGMQMLTPSFQFHETCYIFLSPVINKLVTM